jgi:hypothetical protein
MNMKKVPNSKNYFVCEDGFVYRNGRRLHTNRDTYLTVKISYEDGTRKDHFVHRLVAMMFIPNPHNKPVVNHKDGNKHNNAIENLEWVTHKENALHAVELGLRKRGADCQWAVLSHEQVHQICKMLEEGYRVKDIKEQFCVSQSVISMIKLKKQYVDIASQYNFQPKFKCLSQDTVVWIWESYYKGGMSIDEIIDKYHANIEKRVVREIIQGKKYVRFTKDLTK